MMTGKISRPVWLAIAGAAVVVAVVVVVAGLWAGVGSDQITAAGWAAMILGALVTLALGVGLMSLVFFSNRAGYDDFEGRG